MPRFARQLLIASLVAIHAAVMLLGPCLHSLPGWGHGAAALCRSAHGDDVSGPVNASHLQPDHCAVCHFLAQGQLPIDLASAPSVRHDVALKPEACPHSIIPIHRHTTSPRAPPAPSSCLS